MNICVLLKQVPDKNEQIQINSDALSLNHDNTTFTTNESDTYALEEALQIKESTNAEVTVCTFGPESSSQVLKDGLAKGADKAILIKSDTRDFISSIEKTKLIADVLSKYNFDIIFSGLQSDDWGGGQLGVVLSGLLNLSHASLVMSTEIIDNNKIKVKRELENGWFQWTELVLPSSITIQSGINQPRYASLRGIMLAKNKPLEIIETDISPIKDPLSIKKVYTPEKVKTTEYIDGSPDEIATKLYNKLEEMNIVK